jgi:hypothetical protein
MFEMVMMESHSPRGYPWVVLDVDRELQDDGAWRAQNSLLVYTSIASY